MDQAAFAAAMAPLLPEGTRRLGVAVSGGADSVCLLHLLVRWAGSRGVALTVLTVDHRLRPESAAEAAWVARLAQALGCACAVLAWAGPKPARGVPAAARAARYRLMLKACHERGIGHLALAHHQDDQAETVLLNLARGSGIDGLAAMPAVRTEAGIALLRPLLQVPRASLVASLRALGQDWLEDPSNADTKFARPRLRLLLPALDAAGLHRGRIAGTARRMARARAALEATTDALAAEAVRLPPQGHVLLDRQRLLDAPDEIGLRLLARLIRRIAGPVPLREDRLERLLDWARTPLGQGRTLGGCRILQKGADLLLCRELAAIGPPLVLSPGARAVWDGRFVVSLAPGSQGGVVRALGLGQSRGAEHLPAVVRAGLPALWAGEEVRSAPLAGVAGGGFDAVAVPASAAAREGAAREKIANVAFAGEMVSCLADASAYLYSDGGSIEASPPTLNVACG